MSNSWKVSIKEFLMGRIKPEDMEKEHHENMMDLLGKVNQVRERYGKPWKINDGFRRAQDRPKNGSATSWHYKGAAIDVDDNDAGDFAKWCVEPDNLKFIASLDLYMEDPRWTNGNGSWVHFQSKAPRSGKRVFVPSSAKPGNPSLWDGKYDPSLDS